MDDIWLNVHCRQVKKCGSLLGLSLNVAVGSCVNGDCQNGGLCLAYTKGVYAYAACRCIAGNDLVTQVISAVQSWLGVCGILKIGSNSVF